jgi:hypothetical protein
VKQNARVVTRGRAVDAMKGHLRAIASHVPFQAECIKSNNFAGFRKVGVLYEFLISAKTDVARRGATTLSNSHKIQKYSDFFYFSLTHYLFTHLLTYLLTYYIFQVIYLSFIFKFSGTNTFL